MTDDSLWANIQQWLVDYGVMVLVVFVSVWLLHRLANVAISKVIAKAIHYEKNIHSERDKQLRETTLNSIIGTLVHVSLWAVGFMVILSELGVTITPLIAGAGVAGVALGFGAQSLVRDYLAGAFVLLENQYRVGDVVSLDETAGLVERISLRMTVLRDLDGTMHYIPNGSFDRASNLSKDYANVNVNIGVSYDSDMKKVKKVIDDVGKQMADEDEWQIRIIEPPQFLRIDNFSESAIDVKILGKVQPLEQWNVAGELRWRLKEAFDKHGIIIPYPQLVLHQKSIKR